MALGIYLVRRPRPNFEMDGAEPSGQPAQPRVEEQGADKRESKSAKQTTPPSAAAKRKAADIVRRIACL